MRVIAYGPPAEDKPVIPEYIQLDDGTFVSESGPSVGGVVTKFDSPVEIPDSMWFVVLNGNYVEAMPEGSGMEWRSRRAMQIVNSVGEKAHGTDPLVALSMLRAAAKMVGISLPNLLSGLISRRSPNENFHDTVQRIKASVGK